MDGFDKAINCLFNQSPNAVQYHAKANGFLNEQKKSGNFWQICLTKVITASTDQFVTFWCFKELEAFVRRNGFNQMPSQAQNQFKGLLFQYISKIVVKNTKLPFHIKTRYCTVLVSLLRYEGLRSWGSFFTDFLRVIHSFKGNSDNFVLVLDIFLIFCEVFNQEISQVLKLNKYEQALNKNIKNKLRAESVPKMCQLWLSILKGGHPSLTNKCLGVIAKYIHWIDIKIVTSREYLQVWYKFVNHSLFKNNTAECLNSIALKGMPLNEKLEMLKNLKLFQLITGIQNYNDKSFLAKISKITNSVGMELLQCWQKMRGPPSQFAYSQLCQIVVVALKLFDDRNLDVALGIQQFVQEYITTLGRKLTAGGKLSQGEQQQCSHLLQIVFKKAKFPANFNFNTDSQSEMEIKFLDFRKELFRTFVKIGSLSSPMVIKYTNDVMSNVFRNIKGVPFNDLEIALSIFFYCLEGASTQNPNDLKFFSGVMKAIVTNKLYGYPNTEVQSLVFDIISKHSRLVSDGNDQILSEMLKAFVTFGMGNRNDIVKIKSYRYFSKFISEEKDKIYRHVEKIAEVVIPHTKLEVVNLALEKEDTSCLIDYRLEIFQGLGELLSHPNIPDQKRVEIVKKIVGPVMGQVNGILSSNYHKNENPSNPRFSVLLSKLIMALGTLTKSFQGDGKVVTVCQVYQNVVKLVLNAYRSAPHNKYVLHGVTFFMRTMLRLFPANSLPKLFSPIILEYFKLARKPHEMHDGISLLNQLTNLSQDKAHDLLNKILFQVTRKTMELIQNGEYMKHPTQSESFADEMVLHSIFFDMICGMVTKNKLFSVFVSNENLPNMSRYMDVLLQGVKSFQPRLVQCGFIILSSFLSKLLPKKNQNFTTFVFKNVLPALFIAPTAPAFDLDEMFYIRILGNICEIFKLFVEFYPQMFKNFCENFLTNKFQMNQNEVGVFLKTIFYNGDLKVCQKMYTSLIQSRKQKH